MPQYEGPTYTEIRATFKAMTDQMHDLAREAGIKAGLDRWLTFLLGHNAKVSKSSGKPWREVDYDYVDLMFALQTAAFQMNRVLDALCRELDREFGPEWMLCSNG